MVFHLLFHEDLFGEKKGELLIEAGEVAPLQKKVMARVNQVAVGHERGKSVLFEVGDH